MVVMPLRRLKSSSETGVSRRRKYKPNKKIKETEDNEEVTVYVQPAFSDVLAQYATSTIATMPHVFFN